MGDLKVELNKRIVKDATAIMPGMMVMTTEVTDNWIARVSLGSKGQALLAFLKFGTVGIGFEQEVDWNTNLPCQCPAEQIYEHIKHNKGKSCRHVTKAKCLEAIEALRKIGAKHLGISYELGDMRKERR